MYFFKIWWWIPSKPIRKRIVQIQISLNPFISAAHTFWPQVILFKISPKLQLVKKNHIYQKFPRNMVSLRKPPNFWLANNKTHSNFKPARNTLQKVMKNGSAIYHKLFAAMFCRSKNLPSPWIMSCEIKSGSYKEQMTWYWSG